MVAQDEAAVGFSFGSMTLWVDKVAHATHAEVWLELATADVNAATARVVAAGGQVVDEIEPLGRPDRHWILDPGGTVLLLTPPDRGSDAS